MDAGCELLLARFAVPKKLFLTAVFAFFLLPAYAANTSQELHEQQDSDLFVTSENADITIVQARKEESPVIYWNKKLCQVKINQEAPTLTKIDIIPLKQNAFVQKMLLIPHGACSVKVTVWENKNIFSSSEKGDIRLFSVKAKNTKLYTTHGVIEVSDHIGSLSAETLTSRITIKNLIAPSLNIKTAGGSVSATGIINQIDIFNTSNDSKLQGAFETLHFYSSEGSLKAKLMQEPLDFLDIYAHSFSGDIKIILPHKTDLYKVKNNIDIRSIYGTAAVDKGE